MSGFDAVWAAVQAVFWVTMLGLLVRWPGRVIGIGVALVLWTVLGPWAFWAALGVVAAGALAWPQVRRRRLLVAHPELHLALLGVVGAVVIPVGWVGVVGLAAAVALVGWLVGPALVRWVRRPGTAVPAADTGVGASSSRPAAGFLGGGPVVIDTTTCERCGGQVVGTAQLPRPGEQLGVAHAVCHGCGRHLVGVVDPSAPAGAQVVWMEPPGPEQWERSA